MATTLDGLDFDPERSRAAVAVACLQWLRCTGPAIDPEVSRLGLPEAADPGPDAIAIPAVDPLDWPHPLWDYWLDG